MASLKLKPKAVKVMCNNCFHLTMGYSDETGTIKYQCSRCGTITVSRPMGRRHIRLDVYAPKGQEIIDDT